MKNWLGCDRYEAETLAARSVAPKMIVRTAGQQEIDLKVVLTKGKLLQEAECSTPVRGAA
jgi:hypothetical protein